MAFGDTGTKTIVSGYGPVQIVAAGVLAVGDLVGYSSGWVAADGNAGIPAELVAGDVAGVGTVITAYRGAVVGGVSGATAGNPLYLSDGAGKLTETVSTTSAQRVGKSLTATQGLVEPALFGDLHVTSHSFAAATVTDVFFIAPFRCVVTKISEIHETVAGQAGTLEVERLQGTETPGGGNGDALLNSTKIDLEGTVDTVQSPALTGTAANLILEAGDRLGMTLATGAATSLANACISVEYERA